MEMQNRISELTHMTYRDEFSVSRLTPVVSLCSGTAWSNTLFEQSTETEDPPCIFVFASGPL